MLPPNALEAIAQVSLHQEVTDLAMSWLVKLRQVHHVSESALKDVLRMCTTLHSYFRTRLEKAISTATTGGTSHQSSREFCNLFSVMDGSTRTC